MRAVATPLQKAIDARAERAALALWAMLCEGHDVRTATGSYALTLRIFDGWNGPAVDLESSYPEHVAWCDSGIWDNRVLSAVVCAADAIARAELGLPPTDLD